MRAEGREVPLRFSGKVNIDRRNVVQYLAPSTQLLIEWTVDKGDRVRRGDIIQSYASNVCIYEIPDEELEMEEALRQFESRVLALQDKLHTLNDDKTEMSNELAIARAKLARQEHADPDALELLKHRGRCRRVRKRIHQYRRPLPTRPDHPQRARQHRPQAPSQTPARGSRPPNLAHSG